MASQPPLGLMHPGGCYIFFNAEINTKSMEQLVYLTTEAIRQQFTQITICLSSTGGDPDCAIYAHNALSALPVKVNTHNSGAVQSAAVTLFLAGARRTANPGSFFFFHQTACPVLNRPTSAYLAERIASNKRHDKRTAEIIANKTGGTVQRVYKWQRAELYMGNPQALSENIIHAEIALAIPQNAYSAHVLV